MKKGIYIPFDKAIRAVWVRELKHLPLEMAIERTQHEITAAIIKDKELRSMGIPKWLIMKIEENEI